MARIRNRERFLKATETIVGVDMSMERLVFSKTEKQTGKLFVYQTSVSDGKTAEFTSFMESAEVLEKDGFAEVKVPVFEINRQIPFTDLDSAGQKLGETQFSQNGGYASDVKVIGEQAHSGALHRRNKLMASVLCYHALTKSRDKIEADFNVPDENREVKTTGLWNNPSAPVVDDMANAIRKMKVKPSFAIMSPATYANMLTNGDLRTADNTSTGEKRNFIVNENVEVGAELFNAGKVVDPRVMIDIYVWGGTDENDNAYFPDGYVAYTNSKAGLTGFGGLLVRPKNGGTARRVAKKIDIGELHEDNPVVDSITYKSAPIYILKKPEAFYSQKVY